MKAKFHPQTMKFRNPITAVFFLNPKPLQNIIDIQVRMGSNIRPIVRVASRQKMQYRPTDYQITVFYSGPFHFLNTFHPTQVDNIKEVPETILAANEIDCTPAPLPLFHNWYCCNIERKCY